MKSLRFPIVVLVWAGLCSIARGETALQSPWDSHPVTSTQAPYACPAAPQLPHDFATNSYYIDARHSIPDPVLKKRYEDSVAGIEEFSRTVVKAADEYQTTGNSAAAQCVFSLLDSAAQQKVLTGSMGGHQAFYVQGWNLGTWAVTYLKVRGSGLASEAQARAITSWLKKLAEENRGYYEVKRRARHPNDSDNNHLYWAGFAIAAAGIANDDRKLFDWGMDAYKEGVHDIREDGTLPQEMARGQMALHYHFYALAPLLFLAEFGETNGLPLYSERHYAIKRLIARCISGFEDPGFFQQRTGVAQVTDPKIQAWEISWAQFYTRRFPDPGIARLMGQVERLSYTTLGGLPPP
jgi:poly(beta-D-mannuronate) lyase